MRIFSVLSRLAMPRNQATPRACLAVRSTPVSGPLRALIQKSHLRDLGSGCSALPNEPKFCRNDWSLKSITTGPLCLPDDCNESSVRNAIQVSRKRDTEDAHSFASETLEKSCFNWLARNFDKSSFMRLCTSPPKRGIWENRPQRQVNFQVVWHTSGDELSRENGRYSAWDTCCRVGYVSNFRCFVCRTCWVRRRKVLCYDWKTQ